MRKFCHFIILFMLIEKGRQTDLIGKLCHEMLTCGRCITSDPKCAWCKDEDFKDSVYPRCDLLSQLRDRCKSIENPQQSFSLLQNKMLSSEDADIDHIVQLAPQEVQLQLRPGEPYKLDVHFRLAPHYPVDLYYIMDLSYSMKNHKDKLAALGNQLAADMRKITKNFRLGFGSYVDKVVAPFVSTVPEKLKNPCPTTVCESPYGFRNHMALNNKTEQFQKKVNDAAMSANVDTPEGTLDAIMQAVVCDAQIAWRNVSRKLIVVSTDEGYHIAGDGKLAGIVKPNDGRCHVSREGIYTESSNLDYPSVSHLNEMLVKKNVHLIFAITKNVIPTYQRLSARLEGSGVGKLDVDSTNVVQLIRDQYQAISRTVTLKDDAGGDIRVTYHSRCLNPTGLLQKDVNTCRELKIGTGVDFEVHVEVKSCPEDKNKRKKKFKIWPQGIEESLVVNLDIICECQCEKPGFKEEKSPKCTDGNGTFECGICNCNPQRYGRTCNCGASDTSMNTDEEKLCIKPNSTKICSGAGQCVCGVCDCTVSGARGKPLSGKFCDCDDTSCGPLNGKLCYGHGKCVCGECKCDFGWSGPECNCDDDIAPCIPPDTESKQVCNGNGVCKCGHCDCDETPGGRYIGEFCEDCPSCTKQCETHWPCVVCRELFQGQKRDVCQNFNCSVEVTLVDKLDEVKTVERYCTKKDDDGCKIVYKYGTDEFGRYYIVAQKEKECPVVANVPLIAAAVVGGVVAIGICLLIIWKICTTIHDRREFEKFEKDRLLAKWDEGENPLYKPSTTTFNNPTYPT